MGVRWTQDQAYAIEARGGSLLVSAAAGSGKTAVLSERVIRRVLDPENPVDVDRLLIVTFTEAAVAQMRDKIGGKLADLLERNPRDPALRRQQILLGKAHISTIHAFCLSLVRQNFQRLGLSPDFSVGDENELGNLRQQALQECVEEFYAGERAEEFLALAELVNTGRDDRKLFETVFRLYDFIRSHPFYEDWLDEKLALYDSSIPVAETVWGKAILSYAQAALDYCVELLEEALSLIQGHEKMQKAYSEAFYADRAKLEDLRGMLHSGAGGGADWDGLCAGMAEAQKLTRLGVVRGENENPAKIRVSAIRDEVKSILKKLGEGLFSTTSEEFREDIDDLRPKIGMLFDLTRTFSQRLDEKKRERRMVDFSDLEQFALALLYDREAGEESGRPVRSQLARELSAQFDEIMIDEYQDTNEAQDMIFSAVARRDGQGQEQNLFLVGDVKQSIYRFRQAMPELFMARKKRYPLYDGTHFPARISLGANFRSRSGITDAVNFVFRQLMSEQLGELDYGPEEELIPRAAYPESPEICTEIQVIDNRESSGDDKILLEARYVARRIAEMLTEGYRVSDGEGGMRPATQKDFCVLLRTKKNKLDVFVKELRANGINAWAEAQGGFLAAREISVMLSLLRVLDNPLLEIPLAAIMLSDLFAFTADELARARLADRKRPLWLSLCAQAEAGDAKCGRLVEMVRRFRTAAVTEPVDRLLLRIYRETDFLSLVTAMPMGETRRANLRLLAEYAAGYGKSGRRDLSGFVRFVDQVMERGSDFSPASTLSESADVVRVMTIHHSKGLEFPVVFLSDTAKLHNNGDYTRERSILHSQMGFACKRRDPKLMKEFTTVPMEALKLESERSALSEELRVLYVAMTRAKEKLIVTMVQDRIDGKVKSLAAGLGGEQRVPPFLVRKCRSFADWLLLCAIRHPDGGALRGAAALDDHMVLEERSRLKVELSEPLQSAALQEREELALTAPVSEQELEALRERAGYRYPHQAAARLPAKLGVSAVAEREAGAGYRFTRAPKFLTRQELTAAQRGSALHQFMQFADYARAAENLTAELDRMRDQGYLTPVQRESVEEQRLEEFFRSPLYGRIAASPEVRRELRFLSQLSARELGYEAEEEDRITVQGVADCVFREGGAYVIVDYKTDGVRAPQELLDRYRTQLLYYKKIIEESLHVPVKECVLYSFALGREIIFQ